MSEAAPITAPIATPEVPAQVTENQVAESQESQPKVEQKETPKEPEYFDVKVNGAIKRYTREQLLAKAQLGEAANEKFEQAAKIRSQYEAEQKEMAQDFIKVLEKRGLSKDQIRTRMEQWYHENFIEPEIMTEEQRRTRELERRVKQYEEEKSRQEEEFKTREQQTLETHAAQEMQQQIIEAIEKANLPKTQESARKIAYQMKLNLMKYNFDAPMDVLVQQVKESERQAIQAQVANAPIEYIMEMFGKDLINKIRKYDLKQLESKFNKTSDTPKQSNTKPRSEETKRMSDVDNYFKQLRRSK